MLNSRIITALVCLCFVAACSGDSSSPGAPTPTTPIAPPAQNRPPVINSMNFAPGFGIAQITRFSFNASASDPDGDPITYAWDVAGNAFSGTSDGITFSGGGNGTARLTVTDNKGSTATDTRSFVVGGMTGTWSGSWGGWVFTSRLTQSGTTIAGDYSDQLGPGGLDTAVANTIDANGNIRLRYKQAIFSDFTFTGTMDSTGRRITGVVNGSGATNVPFTMNKQ